MVDHTRAQPGVTEEQVMALWAEPSADPTTPPTAQERLWISHWPLPRVSLWTWAVRSMRWARLVSPITSPMPIQPQQRALPPAALHPASRHGISGFGQAPQGVVALQLGRSALGLEQRGSVRPLRPQCSGLKHGLKLIAKGMAVITKALLGGLLLPLAEQRARWIPSPRAASFAARAVPSGLVQDCRQARAGIAPRRYQPWRARPCKDARSHWGSRSCAPGLVSRS